MADEGGANGIPANQTDDVRRHLLVGHFRNGGVELLGCETLPIQRQAQIFEARQASSFGRVQTMFRAAISLIWVFT